MCGIAGIFGLGSSIDRAFPEKALEMLRHRGPDDSGIYWASEDGVGLAHTRLSIIDLSSNAHQPMTDNKTGLTIVFNGEIYNFREIKKELVSMGYDFFSDSDTEVILKSYHAWKEACLNKFRGMFAFCVFDRQNKELFLARDRFGIKPLYYYFKGGKFIFSSELKAFAADGSIDLRIEPKSAALFLSSGQVPAPLTIYKDIFSLEAGQYLKVSSRGLKKEKYYDLFTSLVNAENAVPAGREASVLAAKKSFEESIKYHLVSDVEIGAFLSGGIDSSAIVSMMRAAGHGAIKTVSLVFPGQDRFDESRYSRLVAKKFVTKHLEVAITEKDLMDHMDRFFSYMDRPTIDGVNTYFISLAAKKAALKTIMSGLGGDEVFGGYDSFANIPVLRSLLNKWRALLGLVPGPLLNNNKLKYLRDNRISDLPGIYRVYRSVFLPADIKAALGGSLLTPADMTASGAPAISRKDLPDKKLISVLEIYNFMGGQLLRDSDIFSMAHSLELRVPFVDHKLIETVLTLTQEHVYGGKRQKQLLIDAVGDLPREVYDRPKMGFTIPFAVWIKNALKGEIEEELKSSRTINKDFSRSVIESYKSGRLHWSKVWALYVLSRFEKTLSRSAS